MIGPEKTAQIEPISEAVQGASACRNCSTCTNLLHRHALSTRRQFAKVEVF
jgi:hypothetical protein